MGLSDTASGMVKDAYTALKRLVRKRLGGGPEAELVVARHEEAPQTWQAPLEAELTRAGAHGDAELIQAAKAVLDLAERIASGPGKYAVDARGASGVQVMGDGNQQHNMFRPGP